MGWVEAAEHASNKAPNCEAFRQDFGRMQELAETRLGTYAQRQAKKTGGTADAGVILICAGAVCLKREAAIKAVDERSGRLDAGTGSEDDLWEDRGGDERRSSGGGGGS